MKLRPALRPPLRAPRRGPNAPREGVGVPWYDTGSSLHLDYVNSRYRWDGQTFTDETAFLTAIGGSKSGAVRGIGPYVAPDATELITNGNFPTDLTGWTTVLNGTSSAAVVAQAAQLISDATMGNGQGGAGITQQFVTQDSRAYLLAYQVGTATGTSRIGTTSLANDLIGLVSAGAGAKSVLFAAQGAASHVYLYRAPAGTITIDTVSAKEARPYKGFDQGSGLTLVFKGKTPTSAGAEKTAFQLYANGIHRIYLRYTTGGNLVLRADKAGATFVNYDLGAYAAGTAFKLEVACLASGWQASLNDGPVVGGGSGALPGLGALTIGNDLVGGAVAWGTGELHELIVVNDGSNAAFYARLNGLWGEGDSFMAGASGVQLYATLRTLMNRATKSTAVGGSTADLIAGRMTDPANTYLRNQTTVIWDGDHNGMTTVTAYCDLLATGIAALGHSRFVILPPCVNYGQSDLSVETAIRDMMLARWPNNLLDWRDFLTLDGNGVPESSMYFDSGTDTTHLSQAAMDLAAAAIEAFINGKGW